VREPFEEQRQAAALGAALKPRRQLAGVGSRKIVILMIARELQDGGGSKAAVEMIVEQHLRQRAACRRAPCASGQSPFCQT